MTIPESLPKGLFPVAAITAILARINSQENDFLAEFILASLAVCLTDQDRDSWKTLVLKLVHGIPQHALFLSASSFDEELSPLSLFKRRVTVLNLDADRAEGWSKCFRFFKKSMETIFDRYVINSAVECRAHARAAIYWIKHHSRPQSYAGFFKCCDLRFANHVTKRNGGSGNENDQALDCCTKRWKIGFRLL